MEMNYLVLLGAAILSMIVGSIWYGPLFGRTWMELIGVNPDSDEEKRQMQKGMMVTFVTQFALTLFQLWVLTLYIKGAEHEMGGLSNALWIWAAFVMPTLASTVLWTNDSSDKKWTRFLIQAGYQLIMFGIFGYIISMWA